MARWMAWDFTSSSSEIYRATSFFRKPMTTGCTKKSPSPRIFSKTSSRIVSFARKISYEFCGMVSYNSRTALTLYRTTDVKSAVTRLGVSVLQDLVLSVAVFRAFTANEHISREYIEDLHRHAQLTARIGSGMTRNTPWISACTLAALLHDIGKLVIAERLPAHLARTLRG